jgi:hypothetical protein
MSSINDIQQHQHQQLQNQQEQIESRFIFWKWSKGEKYERSDKTDHPQYQVETQMNNNAQTIIENALHTPELNGFIKKESKTSGQNEKLSSRHMIVQKSCNPYIDGNNYIQHLDTEASFLRPKDSLYFK